MDQECAPAASVAATVAPGLVDTLIVTTEYAWGRCKTVAVHDIEVGAALEGDAARATSTSADASTELKPRATRATGIRYIAFTSVTVPSTPHFRCAEGAKTA
jgi:hypothetical protein